MSSRKINKLLLLSPAKALGTNTAISTTSTTFIRGKRTSSKKKTSTLSPAAQRAVTQLSVLSASRKQPKLLKLCNEDLIKHQTIQTCWSEYQKSLREERANRLELQYEAMNEAMELLQEIAPDLYALANEGDESNASKKKRFPLEIRVPTDYPPSNIWYYDYKPEVSNDKK
ncbi:related to 54S ribosomal protein L28, mitochondrial [Saccharomycodes ludwigii]|uniref:Large ribosomal subunit protein mL40 n=1 Tax=Saccharomycodes ludwigii TaxID=36035 RepID=A0A376B430_9ASCO|nr:related to 54S ribosomal protein L28, mitochondrial [Saccharomycodes ludwigii]